MDPEKQTNKGMRTGVLVVIVAIVSLIIGGVMGYYLHSLRSDNDDNAAVVNQTNTSNTTNATTNSTTNSVSNSSSNSTATTSQPSVKVTSEGVVYTDASGAVTLLKNVPADRGLINKADYKKATISPNGSFIAMLAGLYEGTKVQVYDIANGTSYDLRLASDSTHNVSGADYQWQSNNNLKVLGVCGIIEECSMFESVSSAKPWEVSVTGKIDVDTKL